MSRLLRILYRASIRPILPGTKALFLFGHLPVPYSGDINPDLHDNDIGAWPADVYYGEFDGVWTDTSVNQPTGANQTFPATANSIKMSRPGLCACRSGGSIYPTLLVSQTKPRLVTNWTSPGAPRRTRHFDTAGSCGKTRIDFQPVVSRIGTRAQTCAAWRSFPSFFGRDQIRTIGPDEYFPTLDAESYLWSYVVSGGSTYGSDNVGPLIHGR